MSSADAVSRQRGFCGVATYRVEAITLLARKYKGTGRVVVFFTRERGKVEAVAQGVGKPGSTLAPAVELFAHSQLLLAEGRQLDRLTQARVLESFEPLRRDPVRLGHAGYVCELFASATEPGEPIPEAFGDLLVFLRHLSAGEPVQAVTASVLWRFLGRMGVAPELEYCSRCGRQLEPGELVKFVPGDGAVACRDCVSVTQADTLTIEPAVRALAAGLARFPVDRVRRVRAPDEHWDRLLLLARLQIQFHLGLELKSAEFLRQLHK